MSSGSSTVHAQSAEQIFTHLIRTERIDTECQRDDCFDVVHFDCVSVFTMQIPFRIIRSDYAALIYGFDRRPNRRDDDAE